MNLLKPPCDEGVISAKKSVSPCGKAQGRWILAATILGSSMSFIDGTVVNVALPALQANLNATAIDVQWVLFDEALAMIDRGEITDAMSQIGLDRVARLRSIENE